MKTSRSALILVLLGLFIAAFGSSDAFAQKKKPVAPPPTAEPQKPTPPPQYTPKGGAMLKDVLVRFKGQHTTIGVLKAVEMDHIIVDDDGTEIIYPMAVIHSLKVLKIDEDNQDEAAPKLEIKLQ